MLATELGDRCLSRRGCEGQRLPYAGHCRECGPPSSPPPPTRCQAPIRCYCWECAPSVRWMLGPHHNADSIRLMLAALDAQRRARVRAVK